MQHFYILYLQICILLASFNILYLYYVYNMYSYRVSIVLYVKPCPPGHVTVSLVTWHPLVTWQCRPWCIALAGTGDWQLAGLVLPSPAIPSTATPPPAHPSPPPHNPIHSQLRLYLYISTLIHTYKRCLMKPQHQPEFFKTGSVWIKKLSSISCEPLCSD